MVEVNFILIIDDEVFFDSELFVSSSRLLPLFKKISKGLSE
jgi:hypothetical protein